LYLQLQVCSLFLSHQTSNQIETNSAGSNESRRQDRTDGWILQVLDDSSLHPTLMPSPAFGQPMSEGSGIIRLQDSEHPPHLVAIRLGNSHGSLVRNEECTRKEDLKHVIHKLFSATQTADSLGRFSTSQDRYSVESRRESQFQASH